MSKRSYVFSITQNSVTDPHEGLEVLAAAARAAGATAFRAQAERGAETKRLHLQGCVVFENARTEKSLRKKFKSCHVEAARNYQATWDYCAKEDSRVVAPVEFGQPNFKTKNAAAKQQKTQFILEKGLKAAIDVGLVPLSQVRNVQHGLAMYKMLSEPPAPLDELQNEWHYGVPGAGKSFRARERYPDAFIKSNDVWWDGYDGQETVIIDEMGPQQISAHHIKQWADKYPFKANMKGSGAMIRPKRIIICSNYSIEQCYPSSEDLAAIKRRFSVTHWPFTFQEELERAFFDDGEAPQLLQHPGGTE